MIKLQLDIQALEKLFPEGSEAYFHFQNAVIAEASKRFTKGLSETRIRSIVSEHVKLTEIEIRKELGLKFQNESWRTTSTLTEEAKKAISLEVKQQFGNQVRDQVNGYLPDLESLVKAYLSNKTENLIGKMVQFEIDNQLAGASDKIKDKIKLEMEKILGPR